MVGKQIVADRREAGTPAAVRSASRSPKSEKKREAIMAAATEIINARTYALATMSEIAAALDLRDGTLYYYYPSKQALIYACHQRSLNRFQSFLRSADALDGSGADKLEQFLRLLLEDSHRHGPLLYFGDYFHLEKKQRQAIAARAAELTDMLEQFLKAGIEDGSITPCDTRLVVNLLAGMLIWLAKWTSTVEDMTVERLMNAISAFSLQGLDRRSRNARR